MEAAGVGISLTGVFEATGTSDPRRLIDWVRGVGVRWIQLDGTMAGTRARELDRSARRDLAASIRRSDLGLTGIDMLIPPGHLTNATHQDRAVAALSGAIELAGELGRLLGSTDAMVVAVDLPPNLVVDVASQLDSVAANAGVLVADHHRPAAARPAIGLIGTGIDPAAMIAAGEDVFDTLTRMPGPIIQARLSDTAGGARVTAGSGDGSLDLVEYASALGVQRYSRPVVADLRGLREPMTAAGRVVNAWRRATGRGMAGEITAAG
ncbi:MAG: hypothetical protein GIKADHBN_03218 [Phycisphaerales bacterium]|nr:hypothetical protein [Phycisphaerales bacterium]